MNPELRIVYIVPQEHFALAFPPELRETFRQKAFAYLYHRYARKVRNRLQEGGINPSDCVVYHEGTTIDQNPDDLKRVFTGDSMAENYPHELSTTFVAPLLREGAGICGVESKEWVHTPAVRIRDNWIALFVQKHLPQNKTGVVIVGAGHNVEHPLKVYNQVEVRTMRNLLACYSHLRKVDNFFRN